MSLDQLDRLGAVAGDLVGAAQRAGLAACWVRNSVEAAIVVVPVSSTAAVVEDAAVVPIAVVPSPLRRSASTRNPARPIRAG